MDDLFKFFELLWLFLLNLVNFDAHGLFESLFGADPLDVLCDPFSEERHGVGERVSLHELLDHLQANLDLGYIVALEVREDELRKRIRINEVCQQVLTAQLQQFVDDLEDLGADLLVHVVVEYTEHLRQHLLN